MEYAKLFFNHWYKRLITIDMRVEYREYLHKQWWENATDEEKLARYEEESHKQESLKRALMMLGFASAFTASSPYQEFDNFESPRSKYW